MEKYFEKPDYEKDSYLVFVKKLSDGIEYLANFTRKPKDINHLKNFLAENGYELVEMVASYDWFWKRYNHYTPSNPQIKLGYEDYEYVYDPPRRGRPRTRK